MWLDTLEEKHYEEVYRIAKDSETVFGRLFDYELFVENMKYRTGFVIVTGKGKIVGCVSFSDFVHGMDITVHCCVERQYQKRWCSRDIFNKMFDYVFNSLDLPRLSSFSIVGKTDYVSIFLEKAGFIREGTKRACVKLDGKLHDLNYYGMLKDECRWIDQ